MKTIFFNKKRIPKKKWLLIDASNKILGRLSSKVAYILQGKNKSFFTPHCDLGDFVIIINAQKICLSRKKIYKKIYYRHTGYPGGLKKCTFLDLNTRFPEKVIYFSIKRMMPKSSLGRLMLKKLKIYATSIHPHKAQLPLLLNI